MEANVEKTFNPWFSMWTKPRATMQQLLAEKAGYPIIWLACVGGISDILAGADFGNMGDVFPLPVIILGSILFGIIQGLLILYGGSVLLVWTGRWIGGSGSYADVRSALAWSQVPIIWGLLLWVIQFILFGRELFSAAMPRVDSSLALALCFVLFGLLNLIVIVWSFVVFFKCLAEAQGLSFWKAFLNNVLAGSVTGVGILLLLTLIDLVISIT